VACSSSLEAWIEAVELLRAIETRLIAAGYRIVPSPIAVIFGINIMTFREKNEAIQHLLQFPQRQGTRTCELTPRQAD
jgi:hypothetical protein